MYLVYRTLPYTCCPGIKCPARWPKKRKEGAAPARPEAHLQGLPTWRDRLPLSRDQQKTGPQISADPIDAAYRTDRATWLPLMAKAGHS